MRLLVVEDNAHLSQLLAKGLQTVGYQTDQLATAADARAALLTTSYAALILDLGLPDDLLFKTMWETGRLEKKLDRHAAAVALYTELASAKNPYRAPAFEELARHYERRERNYAMALEMTLNALDLEPSEALRRRAARLKKKSGDCHHIL